MNKQKCKSNLCLRYGKFENGICPKCTKIIHDKKPTINKISKKLKKQQIDYLKIRAEFLKQNPKCAVTGKQATEIHHMKGRLGSLLCDVRYFLPVCREIHVKIELNPLWAKENGYSIDRV